VNLRRVNMARLPEPFGVSYTVEDVGAARRFYEGLYSHDAVLDGVFAGITYVGIMRDGENQVTLFQKCEGNPLADTVPTLKVGSVPACVERVRELGGSVLIPVSTCPCTGAPFAVLIDASGKQFMVKEARAT
jgi:hypothetical protein